MIDCVDGYSSLKNAFKRICVSLVTPSIMGSIPVGDTQHVGGAQSYPPVTMNGNVMILNTSSMTCGYLRERSEFCMQSEAARTYLWVKIYPPDPSRKDRNFLNFTKPSYNTTCALDCHAIRTAMRLLSTSLRGDNDLVSSSRR